MELITEIPAEISPLEMSSDPVQLEQIDTECSAPTRKRQKQDLSAMKPVRTSGRIRIKMDNAAAARASHFISSNDENNTSQVAPSSARKTSLNMNSSNNNHSSNNTTNNPKSKRKPKQKVRTGDIVTDLNYIDIKKPNNNVLIMFDVSIRSLLTNFAFAKLSPENQKMLIECLPSVDRPTPPSPLAHQDKIELKPSSINNEFFNRACIEWKERLSNGEFTNDFQTKLRAEHEREKSKIDPWKARNFEGIWGFKLSHCNSVNVGEIIEKSALEMKGIVEQGDFEIPEGYISEWKNGGEPIRVDTNMSSQSNNYSSSSSLESPQLPSITTTVPTPPEVTSTQPFLAESPPSPNNPSDSSESISSDLPAIAISSADSTVVIDKDFALPSTSSGYTVDDEYSGDIANQVELSSDGSQLAPSLWEQEHDYLKNVIEPEPSGIDNESELIEEDVESDEMLLNDEEEEEEDDDESIRMIETDNDYSEMMHTLENSSYGATASSYSPQETIRKPEMYTSFPSTSNTSNVLIKNFIHQEPLVVRQIGNAGASGQYNTIIMHKKQQPSTMKLGLQNNTETYLVDEGVDYEASYKDMSINIPKKVVAYPAHGKLNDKIIIEDSICLQPPQQTTLHSQSTSFRTNGTIQNIPNSIIVGNQNFTYVSKQIGNKLDQNSDAARIIKHHETNNNQSQMKQRIIYEIASEPKLSFDQPLSYSTQAPQPEIFHQLIKHPNGTTTIYETTVPPQKKTTYIQRKKDPYTIILTPISNNSTQQQTIQPQPQKSILHIHQSTPIIQTNSSPVQFLANPTTYVKKQTVIHPNSLAQKVQPKYTTVIRAPVTAPAPSIITNVTPKIQKPIQKQKVIMSTSSLQHYRNFGSKSQSNHGPRKQLHPQHIVRTTPTNTIIEQTQHHQPSLMHHHTTPTIFHHQLVQQETKNNQIPVILPNQNQQPEQMLIQNQVQAPQQTVVINPQQTIGNIFVRHKRPQQVFQHQQQINGNSTVTTAVQVPVNTQQALLQRSRPVQPQQQTICKSVPGSVNLERSYQICQAVIQNSSNPNRQQLLNSQMKVSNITQPKKF